MKKMMNENRRRLALALILILMVCLSGCGCTQKDPVMEFPTSVPTEGVTTTPTPTAEAMVTDTPTPTISATDTPTPTEEPVVTETPTPTEEPEPSPTETPVPDTPTPEPTATNTPTPVPTNTPTKAPTLVPTKEPTKAPTNTPTNAPTKAPTATPTNSPTPEPTKAVTEQPYRMWVKTQTLEAYSPDESFTEIDVLHVGDVVTITKTNVLGRSANIISEAEYKGRTIWVQFDCLSKTYVEPKWDAPRERKDLEEILMAKVNAYRQSKGIRKLENPYVYYEMESKMPADYLAGGTPASNLGNYMTERGLRVAKRECLKEGAQHEGSQIGVGWYGSAIDTRQGGLTNEQLAEKLFQGWYNSPGHNANMLDVQNGHVMTAVMTVVEYYNGSYWGYCAIMTVYPVNIEWLPDGLQ